MLGRFTERPSDDESNTFGVWDSAVNGWRATGITNEPKARELASDLDIQYRAHGPRPADAIRHVHPSQEIQRAAWSTGELDVWIRDKRSGLAVWRTHLQAGLCLALCIPVRGDEQGHRRPRTGTTTSRRTGHRQGARRCNRLPDARRRTQRQTDAQVYSWLTSVNSTEPEGRLRDSAKSTGDSDDITMAEGSKRSASPGTAARDVFGTAQQMASCLGSSRVPAWINPAAGVQPTSIRTPRRPPLQPVPRGRRQRRPLVTALTAASSKPPRTTPPPAPAAGSPCR